MKALILAAGFGKRLRPITETMPKSMVPVKGRPLLFNALDNLSECGITEVGIVVGHMADYIRNAIGTSYKGMSVQYFENERYMETNNVVSLFVASDFFDDDTMLLECDVYYRKGLIERLLQGKGECNILVSPFDAQTMDGTVIRVTEGDKADSLILGKWQGEGFDYTNTRKTVNLYMFRRNFVRDKYIPLIRWYVEHMSENSYYEKVLGGLLYLKECDARVIEVPASTWCEVDDVQDLERAESMIFE